MDTQIYLDLTPIDNDESSSPSSLYININAIQAIEKCNGRTIVRLAGVAYKVRESQYEIIEMLDAKIKFIEN